MQQFNIPNLLWYGNTPKEICFPSRWDVTVLEPPGFIKRAIRGEEITQAFQNPIGSESLKELAEKANEVAIVFDDITRPTPVSHVLPWVMEALEKGGVSKNNIRFIPALGMHGAMNNIDFRKKLGDQIVEQYAIYNPNPYENCDYLGETIGGTPIHINREFMGCDLKIAIGCITPHPHVGFGGGGKLIFPGISGIESIHAFHSRVYGKKPESTGLGKWKDNIMYREIAEVVRMSGLQFLINVIVNARGRITDLFVGDPVEAHKSGVEVAKLHYATPPSPGKDIVIANAYAKYNEMAISMFMGRETVNNEAGGTIVLMVDAPEGQICHYLFGSFGKKYGGRMCVGTREKNAPTAPENVKLVVCTQYPHRTMCDFFASPEDVTITTTWEETLALLEKEYPRSASVGVIPDGTMQYFKA